MNNIGKSITRSAKILSQAGQEIDALSSLIQEELTKALEKMPNVRIASDGWEEDTRYDPHEWICTDYSYSLGLKPYGKGKQKAVGYLSVQISLMGDGMEVEGNDEPLLHVCWFGEPIDFDEETHLYFPIYVDEEEKAVSDQEVLLNWAPEATNWQEMGWAYSFQLATINGVYDIKNKIVTPVLALFNGKSSLDALSPNMDGIIRYIPIDEEKGLFRVED